MGWNPPRNLLFPWIDALAAQLKAARLPALRGSTLWIVSDYSFNNRQTDFDVIGLLLADPESTSSWETSRLRVRSDYLGDGRRMAWKKLGDQRRQEAFFPFLQAADNIHGMLVAIAIERCPEFRFSTKELLAEHADRNWLDAGWNDEIAEQLIRVTYFTAMFVAGLSHAGQDVLWISDQDPIFANERFAENCGTLFTKILNAFSLHEYGTIQVGTTSITESDLLEEDLTALPDLIAGAAGELLTNVKREYGEFPRIAVEWPGRSVKADNFLRWMESPEHQLRRRICIIERRRNGALSSGVLQFA